MPRAKVDEAPQHGTSTSRGCAKRKPAPSPAPAKKNPSPHTGRVPIFDTKAAVVQCIVDDKGGNSYSLPHKKQKKN